MVNCNPETVSTDYDTSDRLYFEPLTLEDVLEIVHAEQQAGPVAGVIVQLGGQTPLGLAAGLEAAGVPIVGTQPAAIDLAEERGAFAQVLDEAGPARAEARHGHDVRERQADRRRDRLPGAGAPVVRPGRPRHGDRVRRGARSTTTSAAPRRSRPTARCWSTGSSTTRSRSTSTRCTTAPSCSSAASWSTSRRPACTPATRPARCRRSRSASWRSSASASRPRPSPRASACAGCINIQFALSSDILYVIEANPRASRTVPFVSKATATQLAKAAARLMLGESIAELRAAGVLPATGDGGRLPDNAPIAVKEAVMPFNRFRTYEGTLRRHAARPRDALDRRGHGLRRRLRPRRSPSRRPAPRTGCPPRARSSCRSPTATSGT